MKIDFHVHCFPDELAAKATAALAASSGVPACLDGTVADLKRSMSRAGVTVSIIQCIATKPAQTPAVNDWAARVQDDHVLAFGSIHPGYEGWKEEVERIRGLGLKGVKFHPDYQDFFVDEERVFPLYEEIVRAGLIILFHAGIDIGLPSPCHGGPERLERVVEAFPSASMVAAHMGGFRCWDGVEKRLVGTNLFFDTSYGLGHMTKERFLRLLETHGRSRILFASDSPWADQAKEIEKLEALGLPADAMRAIYFENATRLLGIKIG
jgi:predicted TIM-barrel fold metal-dependent hydrolase